MPGGLNDGVAPTLSPSVPAGAANQGAAIATRNKYSHVTCVPPRFFGEPSQGPAALRSLLASNVPPATFPLVSGQVSGDSDSVCALLLLPLTKEGLKDGRALTLSPSVPAGAANQGAAIATRNKYSHVTCVPPRFFGEPSQGPAALRSLLASNVPPATFPLVSGQVSGDSDSVCALLLLPVIFN
ncbi:hypothetical protein JCGZ_10571 [Jatropha curcas]|uniref:Uncharacterized protein n=1 Tax=Jatropha curcas TaxID=180498 RepID=A0A067KF08_JATCU|nr:hypothetical protein JCGZ_10571 [Jatropha curcas]